jgi:hypothetical protein
LQRASFLLSFERDWTQNGSIAISIEPCLISIEILDLVR